MDVFLGPLADDLPIAIVVIDAQNESSYVNPAWIKLTGLSLTASSGLGWVRALHPDDAERLLHLNTPGESMECRLRAENGECHWVQVTMSNLTEVQNDRVQRLLGFSNVTKIVDLGKALSESSEEFRLIAEAMPQLVWSSDANGRVDYLNAQWIQFTGVTLEDLDDANFVSVIHPDHVREAQERWVHALEHGQLFEVEYRLRSKDGAYKWFIARATPIHDLEGKVVRWVGTATDIDQQKRSAEKLEFVLEAANLFSASLCELEIYEKFAKLAIKKFADWCVITSCEDDGSIKTAAIAHKIPESTEFLTDFQHSNPPRWEGGLGEVLSKNISLYYPSVAAGVGTKKAQAFDYPMMIEQLNICSCMIVPLATEDGSMYGAVTLMSSESGRSFEPGDVDVAEMVAGRAAAAVQSARAFAVERKVSQRLGYIASASELLFESFDVRKTIKKLVHFIVRDLADFSLVLRLEDNNALRIVAAGHHDPCMADKAEVFLGQRIFRPKDEAQLVARMLEHQCWKEESQGFLSNGVWEYVLPILSKFDISSTLLIPLHSRGKTYGLLVVCRSHLAACSKGNWDLPLFTDVGRRTSIAIENGLIYERERRIAETLQKTLLPATLPTIPGIQFSAQYVPSSKECEIGGDWYDAFVLKNGSLVISVGDVMGRGLQAASMMGLVRQAIAVTAMHEDDPARVLDKVDYLFSQHHKNVTITAFLAFIDPKIQKIRYANAGHLYPIILREGRLQELHESRGLPIGLRSEFSSQEVSVEANLEGVELLMLYTDGLIEATSNITAGVNRLHGALKSDAVLRVKDHARFIRDVCAVENAKDDIAILAMRFEQGEYWSFNADNAKAAHDTRLEFVRFLREFADVDDHISAAELVFGELIGNVVRHAPGPIDVQVDWNSKHPVLHVLDRGRGTIGKAQLPQDPLSEGGRGLFIIQSISKEVFVERIEGFGNHVSVVLPIERRNDTRCLKPTLTSMN